MATTSISLLDALAPDAKKTNFPLPTLTRLYSAEAGSFTYEGPILNGTPTPGQWLLTGCTRKYGWQIVQGNFQQGARLIPTANPVLEVEYDVKIWTSADAGVWRKMVRTGILSRPVPIIKVPTPGLLASADYSTAVIEIEDAALNDVGCTKVVVGAVTALFNPLVSSGGKGAWTAKVSFIEFPGAPRPADPPPDQTTPDNGPLTPSAFNAAVSAGAIMTQGMHQRQARKAQIALNQ